MPIYLTTYEIDKFLERYIVPKVAQKDTENLNSFVWHYWLNQPNM